MYIHTSGEWILVPHSCYFCNDQFNQLIQHVHNYTSAHSDTFLQNHFYFPSQAKTRVLCARRFCCTVVNFRVSNSGGSTGGPERPQALPIGATCSAPVLMNCQSHKYYQLQNYFSDLLKCFFKKNPWTIKILGQSMNYTFHNDSNSPALNHDPKFRCKLRVQICANQVYNVHICHWYQSALSLTLYPPTH